MKTNCLFIILAAFVMGSCGQGTPSASATSSTDTTKARNDTTMKSAMSNMDSTKSADADFLKNVYATGLFEIQAGQLAAKTSQNAHVKKFAEMVIQDHTGINKEVSALAQKENVTLPSDLSGGAKDEYTKLQGLTGAGFDKEYIDANVQGHKDAIQLFEKVANGNGPQDSKNLATKDLPMLKKHLEHAEMVQKQLTNASVSSGQ